MDPALLREREAFKNRAKAIPVIEKRKAKEQPKAKPSKKAKPSFKEKEPRRFDYKTAVGSSQYKFAVLAKIVKYMKQRHQQGDNHPLSLEDILDETNQLDVGQQMRHWLGTEALRNNVKIDVVEGDQYKFKPKFTIKGREGLRRLLEKRDIRGLGGILMEDVEESLPNAQKSIQALGDQVLQVTRPVDKKVVLFYNDKGSAFSVDEELQKLWRSVAVEGVDEKKMEDYLQKHGFTSMQDTNVKPASVLQKHKKGNKRKRGRMLKTKDNEHLSDILQDYSNHT